MSNYKIAQTGSLFDPSTGLWLGVQNLTGAEQIVGGAAALPPVTLSVNTSLTAAAHGNRIIFVDTAGVVLTINNDATGGWGAGASLYIEPTGAGTFTLVQGSATLTTPIGTSAASATAVGGLVTADRTAANVWKSTSPIVGSAAQGPGLNTMGQVAVVGSITTGGTSVGTNAGSGRLLGNQYMAFGSFVGVRLIFANFDTAATSTINACAVAAAGTTLQQGNTLNWSPLVTFDGGATTSKTIPAATAGAFQKSAGLVISDFIPVNSIARVDGGTLPILQVRTHVQDSQLVGQPVSTDAEAAAIESAAYNVGFRTGYNVQAGLVANLKTDSMALIRSYGTLQPVGVEFVYANGLNVYGMSIFGDSLVAGGTYTIGNNSPWGHRVMHLAYTAGKYLGTNVFAQNGQTYADTIRIAKAHLAIHKPAFMAFAAWSVNSGTTAAVFDACWGMCLDLVYACRAAGVTPVVWAHAPDQGNTLIAVQNARINGLPSWVCKPDFYTALGNPGSPLTLLPAYWGDGTGEHYNDAGHIAAANEVMTKITPFLN